jgi:dTMP kinase
MDQETTDFYERVRAAYLKIAEKEPERFRVIDASGSIEEVHAKVSEIVKDFLGNPE